MCGYLNMCKLIKNEKCKNQSLSHTNHVSRSQELNVASAYIWKMQTHSISIVMEGSIEHSSTVNIYHARGKEGGTSTMQII